MKSYQILLSILILVLMGLGYTLLEQSPSQPPHPPEPNQSAQTTMRTREDCDGKPTSSLTEGPYYKSGSPERTNLLEPATVGTKLTITGYVFDTNCQSIARAWFDFWQADGNGNYDNVGYKLRGHQFSDTSGKYTLETVIPGRYPGRTPHIHVKVQANKNSPIITTQLFQSQEPQNQQDAIFNQSLVMNVQDTHDGKSAIFNFVLSK